MSKSLIKRLGHVALVAALAAPIGAYAESDYETGTGALNVSANVDFQITIPRFLSLQVGTTGTAVDLISFDVPAANVGDATAIAGTGGDAGAGAVNARVFGNGGDVTLAATTAGAISNGGSGSIDWSEITTSSSSTTLAAPVLTTGSSADVTVLATDGVVDESAVWTYSYANSNVIEAGTYGGVNVNNSRVTYTAALP